MYLTFPYILYTCTHKVKYKSLHFPLQVVYSSQYKFIYIGTIYTMHSLNPPNARLWLVELVVHLGKFLKINEQQPNFRERLCYLIYVYSLSHELNSISNYWVKNYNPSAFLSFPASRDWQELLSLITNDNYCNSELQLIKLHLELHC